MTASMTMAVCKQAELESHSVVSIDPQSGLLQALASSAVGHAAVALALMQSIVVEPTAAADETSVPSVVVLVLVVVLYTNLNLLA